MGLFSKEKMADANEFFGNVKGVFDKGKGLVDGVKGLKLPTLNVNANVESGSSINKTVVLLGVVAVVALFMFKRK